MKIIDLLPGNGSLKFQAWNGAATFSRMLMELMIFWAWYIALTKLGDQSWLAFLLLVGFFLINQFITRQINEKEKYRLLIRILFILWIILFLFFSVKFIFFAQQNKNALQILVESFQSLASNYSLSIFWHYLIVLLIAVRSVSFARFPVSNHSVNGSFRIGIILFCIHAWLFGRFSPGYLFPVYFGFLLLGLISLSTSRIADIGELRGAKLPGFNQQWAWGIFAVCLLGILFAILSSLLLSLPVSEFLGKISVFALQFIVSAIILIFSPIFVGLIFLLEKFVKLIMPSITNMAEAQELDLDMEFMNDVTESIEHANNIDPQSILLGTILLAVLILIIILMRWKPWKRSFSGEDAVESIDIVQPKIKNPFKNLIENLRVLVNPSGASKLVAAAQIRRIYGSLMDLCKKLGKPRPRAATPLEFLSKAEELFPDHNTDLQVITNAYLRIRYGELPEDNNEVEMVKAAWESIKENGDAQLQERKQRSRKR